MSKYDMAELVRRWATEQLTVEQVIGQLLLHVRDIAQRVEGLERQRRPGALPRDQGALPRDQGALPRDPGALPRDPGALPCDQAGME